MADWTFAFMGATLTACASGALWWADERLLCVADLHLGRSERLARRGGALLPPYDTEETVARLEAVIARHDPATVICLGDSLDDDACAASLGSGIRARISRLNAGRCWIWVAGNHDPAAAPLAGAPVHEVGRTPLVFRHAPQDGAAPGEVSGHLHPKLCRPLGGRAVRRPCFLYDGRRLILPAFGAYTGGLAADAPDVVRWLDPARTVAVATGPGGAVALPLAPRRLQRAS